MTIGIIGAGASGMVAAIVAAQNPAVQVHLYERQTRVGRKLLSTGNGRCNLSNSHANEPGHYHGADPDFCIPAMEAFGVQETLDFFEKLGLYTVQEGSGRIYPWSDQASSVLDVLRFGLDRPNIHLHTGCDITKVKKVSEGFLLTSPEATFSCQKLVIACGGLAGTALGGSMAGYQLLKSLGHKSSRLSPALVQLKSSYPRCPSLKGIRAVCGIRAVAGGSRKSTSAAPSPILQAYGEVQFTQYGLSGPAIFDISRHIAWQKGSWVCHLDLLPQMSQEAVLKRLLERQQNNPQLPVSEVLVGVLHNRLGRIAVQEAQLDLNAPLESVGTLELEQLARQVKDLALDITEPMGMEAAQVTAGGVLTSGFDPQTLESRLCPGLYACGEVLDIDGDCGGYNLQWAWSSGAAVGRALVE